MSQPPVTIPKQPVLKPNEDYYRLRREGIGFLEQMASRLWTDYNLHDPGITILETLSYAITDLAYRLGWDIQDILAPAPGPLPATLPEEPPPPFPNQAFFTAREILTINPCTPDDFRRLLLDLEAVRNAWVFCKTCACDLHYYAWCEEDTLHLAYRKPANPDLAPKKVDPLGLYEVLLELEADPVLGDLNNRKIEQTLQVHDAQNKLHPLTLELRFPALDLTDQQQYLGFTDYNAGTKAFTRPISTITLRKFSRSKTANNFLPETELLRYWREVFYVTLEITFDAGPALVLENAALRLFGDEVAKKALQVKEPLAAPYQYAIEGLLSQLPPDAKASIGFVQQYRHKLLRIRQAVAAAKASLHDHRNLDEDYCRVTGIAVEEVAVCADVEVAPTADIERVQAQIWFEIAQYFNPPVPFYTLQELMDAGMPVEDIFNGPALNNGFVKAADLEAAGLKTVLRTSDIINRLMDIEGVIAVNNLLLSKYDAGGNIIKGAADPTWHNGQLDFDPNKSSAAWQLFVSELHQPRLYFHLSRFLFYKNGLPFQPRQKEAYDTLTLLLGEAERPKIKNAPKDLPVPPGTYRSPEDYFPVQYSFPLAYGIGPEGLSAHASPLRRAQARQLKAYLMVFEQLLGNALAQVAHTADLFSLDPAVSRTYFSRLIDEDLIVGAGALFGGAYSLQPAGPETPEDVIARRQALLNSLTETVPEFHERRNRFLDHLMARFGEQFGEYALLLTNLQGQQVGLARLIDDKISFLKAYPGISHDRAKAFNFTGHPCAPDNVSGLIRRISLLLGYPDLTFSWTLTGTAPGPYTISAYQLRDTNGVPWLKGSLTVTEADEATARQQAFRKIILQLIQPPAYQIEPETGHYRLLVQDADGNPLGQSPDLFKTQAKAAAMREELLGWSSQARALVVEHLLLRPKFPGDALYPACTEGGCQTCGDEDPYSFRLTFVMPGWTAPFNVNMDMRRFADRSIHQETPAHLLGKVCWVGNDGFIENACDPVVSELAGLLETQGLNPGGQRPDQAEACTCALAIYTAFSGAFRQWYQDKRLDYYPPEALKTLLETEFAAQVTPADITCLTVLNEALWAEVQALLVEYFGQIARYGWQFERFEAAWCAWLAANAPFDWTEERLQERVRAILEANLLTSPAAAESSREGLCPCATAILSRYGTAFYGWMAENLQAGRALQDFTAFDPDLIPDLGPDPVTLCSGYTFQAGTGTTINALLKERYDAYTDVSYRLWRVVHLLPELRNTYPGATLHDCDDGSDQNPVRLDSTALGNYPLRPTLPPTPAIPDTSAAAAPGAALAGPPSPPAKAAPKKSNKPKKPPKKS